MKLSFLFPALLQAICIAAVPAPYIVTSYVEVSVAKISGTTSFSTTWTGSAETYTNAIAPTVTPIPSTLSTDTWTDSYNHVTVAEFLLPLGSGDEVTTAYTTDYENTVFTRYLIPMTYTPLPACSQTWVYATDVPVDLPSAVETQMVPFTVSPSTYTQSYQSYASKEPKPITAMYAVLNPADIDPADLSSVRSQYEPYEITYCYTPTTTCLSTSGGATVTCTLTFAYDPESTHRAAPGDFASLTRSHDERIRRLDTAIMIAIIIAVLWVVFWLVIGLWENWTSLKGLMLGQERKRGLPFSWCCISFWLLCFVGPTYKAKSKEEQAVLEERWNAMKKGEKFKLWLKWGFRWKYPDVLGEEPERVRSSFRKQGFK